MSWWLLLDSSQFFKVFFLLKCPKLDTLVKIWSHQWWTERNNHFPQPAACTLANMAQYAVHLMCHKGWPLAYFQFIVHEDPLILFCQASFQSIVPQPVLLLGLLCSRDRKLFISLHWTSWGSSKPIPPACWDRVKWQSCPPVHQLLPSMCIAVFSALHRNPTLWIISIFWCS